MISTSMLASSRWRRNKGSRLRKFDKLVLTRPRCRRRCRLFGNPGCAGILREVAIEKGAWLLLLLLRISMLRVLVVPTLMVTGTAIAVGVFKQAPQSQLFLAAMLLLLLLLLLLTVGTSILRRHSSSSRRRITDTGPLFRGRQSPCGGRRRRSGNHSICLFRPLVIISLSLLFYCSVAAAVMVQSTMVPENNDRLRQIPSRSMPHKTHTACVDDDERKPENSKRRTTCSGTVGRS